MMTSRYGTRYKDCNPLQTINNIRNILNGLGILAREDWKWDVEGYYSLNLSITGTSLFSNGKGTSYEYALASAYAELLERLQNLVVLEYNREMRREALEYKGFYHAPDEKHISIREILRNNEKWLEVFTSEAESEDEKRDLLEKWKTAEYYNGMSDFIALPYLSIINSSIYHIPIVMLLARYGSNGMCTGNTPEEALVQGISETIERYVNFKIIKDGIVPPTVPETYIKEKFPHLYDMIRRLENKGEFKVIVKDCSLGQGYPATGAILLDKKRHSYFIKFGAHPAFEIALERCLTELLQGRGLSDLHWMKVFSCSNNKTNTFANILNISVNGIGYYPTDFFSEEYSYEFSEFEYNGSYSNMEMLSYLINLMHGKGYDVLVRDVSFLKFSGFHVVVPFFSEMNDSNPEVINRIAGRKKAVKILLHLEDAGDQELQHIIDFMHVADYNPYDSITKALHPSLGTDFPWNNIKKDLFICSAYYRMKHFKKAYEAMDGFIQAGILDSGSRSFAYFSCIRDYMGARAGGIDDERRISGVLSKFYPEDIVNKVLSDLKNPGQVFKNCARLDCFECSKCTYIKYCTYPQVEKIYMKLKDRYAENVIDQNRNKNLCIINAEVEV